MDSVDVGFIACNTAHILFDKLNKICSNKLISILDIQNQITTEKVGLVCSPFTARRCLYGQRDLILPSESELSQLNKIIRQVIANKIDQTTIDDFRNIILSLKAQGCRQIIIGCSELSILLNAIKESFDGRFFIDPISLVIERLVNEE
jgi:aspartate/glutamate racemase